MNFIKRVFEGGADEGVHRQFVRFGKGEYNGRAVLRLRKTKNIKIKSSFEFANDFVRLCLEFNADNYKVFGIILSKKNISDMMSQNNIKGNSETKRGGLYYQNNISNQELNKEQLLKLEEASYFALLDIEGDGFALKTKKKLPKPGKIEGKVDDKFCQLELDGKYYGKVKEDFFWDLLECKKASIKHKFVIDEIVSPEGEKDFAKIRETAKRKGKIIRIVDADGKETRSEREFEA